MAHPLGALYDTPHGVAISRYFSPVAGALYSITVGRIIVKEEDIPFLAQSAYDDACRPGNPRETSVEEIAELYKSLI